MDAIFNIARITYPALILMGAVAAWSSSDLRSHPPNPFQKLDFTPTKVELASSCKIAPSEATSCQTEPPDRLTTIPQGSDAVGSFWQSPTHSRNQSGKSKTTFLF